MLRASQDQSERKKPGDIKLDWGIQIIHQSANVRVDDGASVFYCFHHGTLQIIIDV